MKEYELHGIGESRGNPRFYKQGKRLALAGFVPGVRFSAVIHREEGFVVLKVSTDGDRIVSRKVKGEGEVPVIDINSGDLLSVFEGMDKIRVVVQEGQIVLLAMATEVRRMARLKDIQERLENNQPLLVGSTSHGAGILSHAIHKGLQSAGIATKLAFANDIEGDYLDQAETHNDAWSNDTIRICSPLQSFAFDDWAVERLPRVSILEGGLPCTAASVAGRAKKALAMPDHDKNVGHLIVSFLNLVHKSNAAIVLLENVPLYLETASYAIYKTQMDEFGYDVKEMVLEARDFGALENRKRMCSVAVTKGMEFDFSLLEFLEVVEQKLGEILDPVPADDPVWSPMEYLKVKEKRVPDSIGKYTFH